MTCRKKDTRRSRFNLWNPAKVVPNKPDTSPAESGTSESPVSDATISESGRSRLKHRLTQSGSRILIFLGLRGSSKSNKQSTTDTECSNSIQTSDDSIDPPSPPFQGGNGEDTPEYLTAVDSPEDEPLPATPLLNTPIESAHALSEPLPGLRTTSSDTQDETTVDESLHQDPTIEIQPTPVAQTPSTRNSKFVDRFSHKISLAFGQPTVIRHASLNSRPSILHLNSPVLEELSKQGDCANDSSDPSTTPSSGSSPVGGRLAPLTPLTTGVAFSSSEKAKLCDGKIAVTHWHSLSEIEAATSPSSNGTEPEILPSIRTVEATSVAKIYLELYFNSIFQNENLRRQRQLELEQQIYSFELSPEECSVTRRNWILRENDYLRQCRVLKSNRYSTQSEDIISIAGYKAIKVLGKGSFGVVRLVRKNGCELKGSNDENPLATNETSCHTRSNPLEALMSVVEGAKQSRRRYMTGERKEVYAMKVIKKAEMIRNSQEGHIRAERDFLVASESSQWVVPLIASFQDTSNLYLVMDYMVGGDFLGLLIRKDTLREDWAQFYVAEMILCIEEAHRLFWIHRDIKPDNFLISASGHLKISDFGLAFNGHWSHDQAYYNSHRYSLIEKLGIEVKGDAEDQKENSEEKELASDVKQHGMDDQILQQSPSPSLLDWRDNKGRRRFAKSVVGTSQYMAPEVIRGEMYDGRCDWWSLGIILYECLYGITPFACENRHDTKIKIIQHRRTLQFPREKPSDKIISAEAIDLITRILQEREYRLCSPKYQSNDILNGRPVSTQMLYSMDTRYRNIASYYVYANDATDIKIHPFFRGIRWHDLHMCRPPMIPRVRNWEDTRYFDDWKLLGNAVEHVVPSNSEEIGHCLASRKEPEAVDPGAEQPLLAEEPGVEFQAAETAAEAAPDELKAADKKKETKRPRDKILRDKQLSRTVLEIRKKGAFLGYTYRRPNEIALALSTERGRQRHVRGDLASLYVT